MAGGMRMGVAFTRLTVGRPAGVSYARGAAYLSAVFNAVIKVFNSSFSFDGYEVFFPYGYSRRIVAAVFKGRKSLKQDRHRLLSSCVSNDATHI